MGEMTPVEELTVVETHLSGRSRALQPACPERGIYHVGTLRYTIGGLAVLFCWLLWGDLAATMFLQIFGVFLPLYLKGLGSSNVLIAFLATGVGGLMNLTLMPNISIWSDRHRGRWGRRIPFLLWSAPIATIALIGVGLSSDIAQMIRHTISPLQMVSRVHVTVVVVSVCIVVYSLFQMITNNTYQFLLRDVVPQESMAWFISLFRVVGTCGTLLFQWFMFGFIKSNPAALCIGLGAANVLGFLLISWRVKEGRYPPPPARNGNFILGQVKLYRSYLRNNFAIQIYRDYIVVWILVITGLVATASFLVLFCTKTLDIGVKDYGRILFYGTLATAVLYVPIGYLCNRLHSIRVMMLSLVGLAIGAAIGFFLVFDRTELLVYSIMMAAPTVAWQLGSLTLAMELYPADEFGQFSSALYVFGCGSLLLTSYVVGKYMDLCNGHYRMIFLVQLVCFCLALVPMVRVYRGWKRHGGPDHYMPPKPRKK